MTSDAGSSLSASSPAATPALRTPAPGHTSDKRSLLHSGVDVSHFISMHILGAIFPLSAGLLLYGWRALILIILLCTATGLSLVLWRRVGRRGRQLRYDHALWLALLLSLTFPAHLLSGRDHASFTTMPLWPIIPAAGIALSILLWMLGGAGSGRVHAVLIVHLLLVVLFKNQLVPHYTLQRMNLFRGDVLDAVVPTWVYANRGTGVTERDAKQPWIDQTIDYDHAAVFAEPASQRLIFYTTGTESPERSWLSMESLLRDRMPPLEDLIIGGQPGPIGTSSAIAVIVGGLFLMYRGLIDHRVPMLIFLTAYLSMLILPVPVRITDSETTWQWFIARPPPIGVGWRTALTFVHYELMASPLLFMSFFLATAPAVRPLSRRGCAVYAILVGALTAIFQLYMAVSIGPYLALLGVSLLTPLLEDFYRPRTLV